VASKRASITDLIQADISSRNLNGNETKTNSTSSVTPTETAPVKKVRKQKILEIRLESDDWEKFKVIANKLGSNGSVLIRTYIKMMIRTGGIKNEL
jgi:phosphoribosylformylglycinamidine (FGAM) synthase PurS component